MLREKDQARSIRSHGPGERKPIVQRQPIRFPQHQLSFKFCGNVYRMGIDVLCPRSHPFSDDLISSLQVLIRKDICCCFLDILLTVLGKLLLSLGEASKTSSI